MWWNILQMLVALAFIIVLANIILKKLSQFNQTQTKAIKIIERLPVSKQVSLNVVEIGHTFYLMSVSEKGSEILKELSEEDKEEIIQKVLENQRRAKQTLDPTQLKVSFKETIEKAREKYDEMRQS
jgi:flagellar protein FliO/FliZ